MWFPLLVFASINPFNAKLIDSVAPEVKIISLGEALIKFAT
jgi:hypothetical protein